MPLITDPDDLSQGASSTPSDAAWGTPTGNQVTITSAGNSLPTITAGMYFEVRDHSVAANNGLYKETGGTPSASSVTATKIGATAPVTASAEAITWLGNSTSTPNQKSVMFDTASKLIYLLEQGNLSTAGVTMLALHSFIKEEWKNDAALIPFAFPMIGIDFDAGKWEFGVDPSGNNNGWRLEDDTTPTPDILSRRLVRNAGWFERDSSGNIIRKYAGIVTLGTFEDSVNDLAYYQQGADPTDTGAAVNFQFNGPVNEVVLFYRELGNPATCTFATSSTITRASGSFITDGYKIGGQVTIRAAGHASRNGTFTLTNVEALTLTVSGTPYTTGTDATAQLSVDNSNALKLFLRIRDGDANGKTFAQANLVSAGETSLVNKVVKFPLGNQTDLKIDETDANIAANSPYTGIRLRYLATAYNRDIDLVGTPRNFGIVVDVGSYSQSNGVSAGSTLFTSAAIGTITVGDFTGGTLIIHEGTDKGSHTVSGTPVNNAGTLEITLTVALTGSQSGLSFTLQRATPLVATAEQIYEKVQYLLRQAADVDGTSLVVTGKTADAVLTFVGDTLQAGTAIASTPNNPNGGGSGVVIEGFSANDTNRLEFYDNVPTKRTFPFVAAGSINFNANLVTDGVAKYWMFYQYTERFTNTGFGLSAPSGANATLDSSTTSLVAELAQFDYIVLSGFANSVNNGIYQLTGAPAGAGPWTAAVRKVNGDTLIAETAGPSVSLDKNPVNTPDAIIVKNNAGSDITGTIGGSSVAFDFDYDNNVQGGRTSGTDAAVVIRAIGLTTAQFVETTGSIARATGQVFSLVSSLERNYDNP